MSTFAERLKELRGPESQASFAGTIGINKIQYAKYEGGKNAPSIDVLTRICRAHACSADWLLGLSDKSSPNIATHGSNSPVVTGSHNSVTLGESLQCSKCPYKKKLKGIEKLLK